MLVILSDNFLSISLKIINLIYRIILYTLFIYLCFNYFKFDKNDKILIFITLLYFILRITLFSQVYFTATRHLLQPLIMIEMTVLIIFLKNQLFLKLRNRIFSWISIMNDTKVFWFFNFSIWVDYYWIFIELIFFCIVMY